MLSRSCQKRKKENLYDFEEEPHGYHIFCSSTKESLFNFIYPLYVQPFFHDTFPDFPAFFLLSPVSQYNIRYRQKEEKKIVIHSKINLKDVEISNIKAKIIVVHCKGYTISHWKRQTKERPNEKDRKRN